MTKEEFFQLGEQYAQGKCTRQEAILYEQIMDRFENDPNLGKVAEMDDNDLIGVEMLETIKGKRKRRFLFISKNNLLKVAASIVFILGIGLYVTNYLKKGANTLPAENTIITKITQIGEKLNFTLSDGTMVELNAGSSITYNKKFDETHRFVTLQGEAFFDVVKNPKIPFIIKTEDIKTTVLGTSLNINAYLKDEISVTVATGEVLVQKEGSDENEENYRNSIRLLPGFQGQYSRSAGKLTKKKVDISQFTDWHYGIITFKNASESEVIKILERWYSVNFSIHGTRKNPWNLNAGYDNKSLVFVLNSLSYSVGFQYELKDDYVTIKYNQKN